jgi:hypothetical protein
MTFFCFCLAVACHRRKQQGGRSSQRECAVFCVGGCRSYGPLALAVCATVVYWPPAHGFSAATAIVAAVAPVPVPTIAVRFLASQPVGVKSFKTPYSE